MKIAIVGSKGFKDYTLLSNKMDTFLSNVAKEDLIEIVSGGAAGADLLGEAYARNKGYGIKRFLPLWKDIAGKPKFDVGVHSAGNKYWKSAGFERNKKMAEYSDAVVAFWDGVSTGTKHMIEETEGRGKPIRIVYYLNYY